MSKKWQFEGIWWLVAALISILVVLPIVMAKIDYPFLIMNIYFILGTVLWIRWLFLWKYTPYAWSKLFKLGLIFLLMPLVFMFISNLSVFQNYLDEIGIQEFVKDLPTQDQDAMSTYIRTQMIFFGTANIIGSACIPPKMIWSIWKQYNRNEV